MPLSAAPTVRITGVIADVEDRNVDGHAPPTLHIYRFNEVSGAVLLARGRVPQGPDVLPSRFQRIMDSFVREAPLAIAAGAILGALISKTALPVGAQRLLPQQRHCARLRVITQPSRPIRQHEKLIPEPRPRHQLVVDP